MKLINKLKRFTTNQYKNSIDSHDYNYWQNEKYKVNSTLEEKLPESKRLAIFLYGKLYKLNENEMNKWIEESPDFIHNWDGKVHKKYLNMAMEFLGSDAKHTKGKRGFISRIFGCNKDKDANNKSTNNTKIIHKI